MRDHSIPSQSKSGSKNKVKLRFTFWAPPCQLVVSCFSFTASLLPARHSRHHKVETVVPESFPKTPSVVYLPNMGYPKSGSRRFGRSSTVPISLLSIILRSRYNIGYPCTRGTRVKCILANMAAPRGRHTSTARTVYSERCSPPRCW